MNKLFAILFLVIPSLLTAQVVSDARLWTGFSISKQHKKFTFSVSEEIRFEENVSHLSKVFTELGVDYKVKEIKGLSIGFNYRFNRDNDYQSENYDLNSRVDFSLSYKRKFDKLRVTFRTKFQTKSASSEENNTSLNRNKLSIKYKLKNAFTPYISYEVFYQFNDIQSVNRTRFSLGTSYKINKHHAFKAFYIFENRFNSKNLRHNHIWGVSYSLDI